MAVFAGAALVLLLTPGPAVLYIVTQSMRGGFRAGFVSCLGLLTGGAIHLVVAIAGLAVVLTRMPAMFTTVKLAGAAYLMWLALREARRALAGGASLATAADASPGHLYRQGVLVNVLNPKAPLFFLAFLPQFVTPDAGPVWVQLATVGALFLILGLFTDSTWAFASARLGTVLRARLGGGGAVAGHWLAAAVYALLAVGAALSGG